MKKTSSLFLLCLFSFSTALFAQEKLDLATIDKIKEEGLKRSQIMDIMFNLTDVSGNRLMNSPGYYRAANYAKDKLVSIGLSNAALDAYGEFGKGWELEKSYLAMTAPYYRAIQNYPKAWTGGTKGLKNAEIVAVVLKDSAGLEQYRGTLKGKIIIIDKLEAYKQSFKADAVRFTDEELEKMANAAPMQARGQGTTPDTAMMRRMQATRAGGNVLNILKAMAISEGAVAMLTSSPRFHDGTIFSQGGGGYKGTDPENFLDIAIGIEDYNTILRLVKAGKTVKLDADVKTKFYNKDLQGYNVIAEIPGTDPVLKDEIVMIGAHLDSWHAGTGATDNASGSAVMMEALRILKTVGINNKRTIRIGLWGGEEQGLTGSRGYVKKTFADPATMELLPSHEKFSSYFNIDNGTGKVRGIYLQNNAACKEIFEQWFAPLKDLTNGTITISNTGGTDHQSFDGVGLPGFQFIQDPIEYDTRTHHSNMDVLDHVSEEDLKQIATIVATFVFDAAQRDQKLPRNALPKPRPGGQRY
ncbi:MAG: M20/M25/M40 family metallo-hydrolase [Chitinophagaceae bacterium]|nr:M20/M25/M40 family metallo-hydrolase [Chitinophagaceae bacterium]